MILLVFSPESQSCLELHVCNAIWVSRISDGHLPCHLVHVSLNIQEVMACFSYLEVKKKYEQL